MFDATKLPQLLNLSNLALLIIGVVLSVGFYTDWTRRQIPNWINLVIFCAGFFTNTATIGGKLFSLASMVVVLFFLSKTSGLKSGGGDIKLYLSLSFALGVMMFSFVLFLAAMFISFYAVIKRVKLRERFALCCFIAPAYWLWFIFILVAGVVS